MLLILKLMINSEHSFKAVFKDRLKPAITTKKGRKIQPPAVVIESMILTALQPETGIINIIAETIAGTIIDIVSKNSSTD